MKREYLAESGHGFIEFDPNNYIQEPDGESHREDSFDHVDFSKTGRSVKYLIAKYGYDPMTAREHLYNQGVDFDEVLWWEDAMANFDDCYGISKPYQFDSTK